MKECKMIVNVKIQKLINKINKYMIYKNKKIKIEKIV